VLGVQIIAFRDLNKTKTVIVIGKILLLSLILRASAYFISPYPAGSDPWAHREYIVYFLESGRITVPSDFSYYYVNYPVAHLHSACTSLLTTISPHDAMFLWGAILTFSTLVTFLIVRMLTGNTQLALISMLLLNFVDVHIQWSIQNIAMSFGIAIFAFIIFFVLRIYTNTENKIIYVSFMLIFLGLIVWTHTISAFITLVSLFALIMGHMLYEFLYDRNIRSFRSQTVRNLMGPLVILAVIITYHWIDPSYPFLNKVFSGLLNSLSQEAGFLGATTLSNVHGRWEELLQPVGFCICASFGIIGALYCSFDKERAKKYFPLISLVAVLFFIRYAFPIFGMRNIIPDRWPAFAFVCFALFIGFGILCILSLMKTRRAVLCTVTILFLIGSLLMITNSATNQDSPLYGGEVSPNLIWTESEMSMYAHINETYDGIIIADEHTHTRPFSTYLKNENSVPIRILSDGTLDLERLSSGLVIWRQDSLNRPVVVMGDGHITTLFLGDQFREYLDSNYNCILATHGARGYIPDSQMIVS